MSDLPINPFFSCRNGSNVEGYFVWSFVDCFEYAIGNTFGVHYVDFEDRYFKRHPTPTSIWYSNFLHGKVGSEVKRTCVPNRAFILYEMIIQSKELQCSTSQW
ncbi:hypothetical protein AMTRI_Chr06g191080 [Amborella trichopoda]